MTTHGARGQATTETIMLTWLLLIFFAAVYQIYLVNEAVYRSMAAVQLRMFQKAWPSNCFDDSDDKCRFSTDGHAHVIWRVKEFPELKIRTVNMFKKWGMPDNMWIYSNDDTRYVDESKGCPVLKCKHTKMAVGTYWPIMGCALFYDCLD